MESFDDYLLGNVDFKLRKYIFIIKHWFKVNIVLTSVRWKGTKPHKNVFNACLNNALFSNINTSDSKNFLYNQGENIILV